MSKIALQLYSIREICENNFEEVIKNVSEIGYEGVELFKFYDYSKQQMKQMLDKYNLKCISVHTSFNALKDDLENIVDYNKYIGTKYITIPWFGAKNADEWLQLTSFMKSITKKLNENGLELLYHNHSQEFDKLENGENAFEILLNNTNKDELNFEIDCYWVTYSNINITNFISQYMDRIKLLHIKDMKIENETKKTTEVGTGIIDYKEVLNLANANNMEWVIVEQDVITMNYYDSVKISFDNLKSYI